MSFKVPNLDLIWSHNPLLAEALQAVRDGIDTLGTKLSVNPQGPTLAPAPPSAINVVAQGGVSHVTLTDNSPRTRNTHYFVEWDTSPNFSNAQTIHLGPTRQARVPTFIGSNVYWRGYAQLPDGPRSSLVYHGSPQKPIGVSDGAVGTGVAPSTLLLETNGTTNGSQSILNLNAGSNVSLTDAGNGTITLASTASGPIFSTSGQGGFWGPGILALAGQNFNASVNIVNSANEVRVYQFMLLAQLTVSKINVRVTGGANGNTAIFGIYNAAGTSLLLNSGTFTITSVPQSLTNSITPVTLMPGVYMFAQSSSTSTNFQTVGANNIPSGALALYNITSVRAGIAANGVTGGNLPATLGVITADSTNTFVATPFFEP